MMVANNRLIVQNQIYFLLMQRRVSTIPSPLTCITYKFGLSCNATLRCYCVTIHVHSPFHQLFALLHNTPLE